MLKHERVELILITMSIPLLYSLLQWLPSSVQLSHLMFFVFSLLLTQGLLRDLALLYWISASDNEAKEMQCMCMESSIGMSGIVLASIVLFSGIDRMLSVLPIYWLFIVPGVLIVGFVIKDYVISWRPWSIYKHKDHLTVVVRLK